MPVSEAIPKVFLTRIKRLLEFDRKTDFDDAKAPPRADYAFAAPASEGSGEIAYTQLDALRSRLRSTFSISASSNLRSFFQCTTSGRTWVNSFRIS